MDRWDILLQDPSDLLLTHDHTGQCAECGFLRVEGGKGTVFSATFIVIRVSFSDEDDMLRKVF